MQVQLTKPELTKFVDEKVKPGDFPTADAVIEDALLRMMEQEQLLTTEDVSELDAADEAMDRGEYVDFNVFAQKTRAKFSGR